MGVRVCGRVGVGVGFGCVFLPALLLPRGGVALWLLAVGRSDGREREREREQGPEDWKGTNPAPGRTYCTVQ